MGLISQTLGRREDPLEEEMATHSNTLYLRISLKNKKQKTKTTYCVSCTAAALPSRGPAVGKETPSSSSRSPACLPAVTEVHPMGADLPGATLRHSSRSFPASGATLKASG